MFDALRMIRPLGLISALGVTACSGASASRSQEPAQVADTRASVGEWTTLFDGTSLDHWRGFRMNRLPGGWVIADGSLHFQPGGEGGDIVTRERFSDFELELEWRLAEGGNSGIFFRVDEAEPRTFESGPEMQVLDNQRHADGRNPLTSAGANYALHAPSSDAARPVGEWNQVRLVVKGPHVEHWLNGSKVVDYELWTEDWRGLVAGSKFVEWPRYGLALDGHIALQDHGDPVWFRHIRARRLN